MHIPYMKLTQVVVDWCDNHPWAPFMDRYIVEGTLEPFDQWYTAQALLQCMPGYQVEGGGECAATCSAGRVWISECQCERMFYLHFC